MMLGMSQTELGRKLGITFQEVQKYENGTSCIGAGRLQHIAKLFRVPVQFFFEGAPGTVAHQDQHPAGTAESLATTDTELRRLIVALVKEFVDDKGGRR
jgi:transcriptional regulator with XRE-family HTH domain